MKTTNWQKHTGTSMPSELAPMQIVETREIIHISYRENEVCESKTRADHLNWGFFGGNYRPVLDPDGIPYCSAEGLEGDTRYVAVEECEIGGKRVLQFKNQPRRVKPSLISPERWSDGSDNGRTDAPETHRKPGDPADSLMRVWRPNDRPHTRNDRSRRPTPGPLGGRLRVAR